MKEYKISLQGKEFDVVIKELKINQALVEINGNEYAVGIESKRPNEIEPLKVKPVHRGAAPVAPQKPAAAAAGGEDAVVSPLPGVIMKVSVNEGDTVKTGQTVVILEAMKMENEVRAHKDGKITEVLVKNGDSVIEGAALVKIGG